MSALHSALAAPLRWPQVSIAALSDAIMCREEQRRRGLLVEAGPPLARHRVLQHTSRSDESCSLGLRDAAVCLRHFHCSSVGLEDLEIKHPSIKNPVQLTSDLSLRISTSEVVQLINVFP